MRPWIRSVWNILPKRRRCDDFLAQNTIWSAKTSKCKHCLGKYQQNQLIEIYLSTISKRDLKHSGTFFKKMHATLDSQLILFAQKAPAGRLSGSKYNLFRPKGPCGTLFWLKIHFDPPKGPLRDDLLLFPKRNIWHWDRNYIFHCFVTNITR